jgi:hypothetical protein
MTNISADHCAAINDRASGAFLGIAAYDRTWLELSILCLMGLRPVQRRCADNGGEKDEPEEQPDELSCPFNEVLDAAPHMAQAFPMAGGCKLIQRATISPPLTTMWGTDAEAVLANEPLTIKVSRCQR